MCNSIAKRASVLIVGVTLAAMAGCESMSHRVGQSATVQFGVVQSAQEVTLDSNAAQGALIGGTIGVLSGGQARGAITGAAVGGVATAAAQGNRRGTQYTVQMMDGSSTRIVSDQHQIHVNDCVAIERVGGRANIRRASPDYCDPANAQAVKDVSDVVKSEAIHCDNAKQELAKAQDNESMDLAIRKVELLCDD